MVTHKEAIQSAMMAGPSNMFVRQGTVWRRASVSSADVENIIRAYLDARGLVMVPKEPTDAMKDAIQIDFSWSAMLAAAPDPF